MRENEIIEKTFRTRGLRCFVRMNTLFCRCGYVEAPLGRLKLEALRSLAKLDIHGGVTCCCVSESPIDGETVLLIGFETCHDGDMPDVIAAYGAMKRELISRDEYTSVCEYAALTYGHTWTLDETKDELRRLARAVADALITSVSDKEK